MKIIDRHFIPLKRGNKISQSSISKFIRTNHNSEGLRRLIIDAYSCKTGILRDYALNVVLGINGFS